MKKIICEPAKSKIVLDEFAILVGHFGHQAHNAVANLNIHHFQMISFGYF